MAEKKKTVAELNADMRKTYGKIMPDPRDAGTVKRLILSDPGLNRVWGGGFPRGRVVELFGPESGGKTTISTYVGGDVQEQKEFPPLVLFIDMEHSFNAGHAETTGLVIDDPLRFQLVRPFNGEQAFEIAQKYVETGEVGLIIWDSVAATSTAAHMADEYGKRDFGGTALLMSEGLKKFNPYLSNFQTGCILINQIRDNPGAQARPGMPKPEKTTGGNAVKFYASLRNRISSTEPIYHLSEQIGNKIRVKNVKSKVGVPKRETELELIYASGFNPDRSYLEFIKRLEIVTVRGSYYSSEEFGLPTVQGGDKFYDWLLKNQDAFDVMKSRVNESFLSANPTLDVDTMPDVQAEYEAALIGGDDDE